MKNIHFGESLWYNEFIQGRRRPNSRLTVNAEHIWTYLRRGIGPERYAYLAEMGSLCKSGHKGVNMELKAINGDGIDSWREVTLIYNAALRQLETKMEILNDEFQHASV